MMEADELRIARNMVFFNQTDLLLSDQDSMKHSILMATAMGNFVKKTNCLGSFVNFPKIFKDKMRRFDNFQILFKKDFFSFIKYHLSQNKLKLALIFGDPELYDKILEILPSYTSLIFIASSLDSKSRIIREEGRMIRYLSINFILTFSRASWWLFEPYMERDERIKDQPKTEDGYLYESFVIAERAFIYAEEGNIKEAHENLKLAQSYPHKSNFLLDFICSIYLKIAYYQAKENNFVEFYRLIEYVRSIMSGSIDIGIQIRKTYFGTILLEMKKYNSKELDVLLERVIPFVKKYDQNDDLNATIYLSLALLESENPKNLENAENLAIKALSFDPDNQYMQTRLGIIYFRRSIMSLMNNRHEEAIEYCEKALKYDPNNRFIYSQYGRIYHNKACKTYTEPEKEENFQKAEVLFLKANTVDVPDYQVNLAFNPNHNLNLLYRDWKKPDKRMELLSGLSNQELSVLEILRKQTEIKPNRP